MVRFGGRADWPDSAPRRAAQSSPPAGRTPARRGERAGHRQHRAPGRAARPNRARAAGSGAAHPRQERTGHAWYRPYAGGETLSTYPDHILRVGTPHLSELKRKAAEFERQLWDAHESLEQEMEQSELATQVVPQAEQEAFRWTGDEAGAAAGGLAEPDVVPASDVDADAAGTSGAAEEQTARLI